MPGAEWTDDLRLISDAARAAGRVAMGYFGKGARRWTKNDSSPVTEADIEIDRMLKQRLGAARPDYGWLSEEIEDDPARLSLRRVFIVDPIDGTRAFVDDEPGWVVSIAVVEDQAPVAGVLFDPVNDVMWRASKGGGAWRGEERLAIGMRATLAGAHIAASSKAVRVAGLSALEHSFRRSFTKSLAHRLALVACGTFDAALAASSASDWDLAAGALLVQEAGGRFSDLAGCAVRFNRPDTQHPPLVAAGPRMHAAILAAGKDVGTVTEASE